MSWLRVDDGFTIHPKITSLSDKDFRIWVRILCFSARNNSKDGALTGVKGELRGVTDKVIKRFIAARLIDVGTDGVMRVHDWSDYARGRSDPTNAERQARFRESKKDVTPPDDSNVTTNADSHARAHPLPSPAPTQPKDSSEPKGSSSSRDRQRFNEVWDAVKEMCGDVTNGNRKLRARIVNDLVAEGATAADVYERHPLLELRWPSITITDTALRKHWGIALKPLPRGEDKRSRGESISDRVAASRAATYEMLGLTMNGQLEHDLELDALEAHDG